ncbi:hypothetical protein [Myxococcus sp. RHSTA-1-4]|uniref:hypothetical protein n=1 Tax=Myxococcus sp. RHSTA-1-4 TaxID=2874601 RepID=UPI001CC18C8D|nr:hypothetical protein [Myxococcus sp. RHSTA-1-4]MBZ4418447.1 hypothetical protein [Myxococcus sp. RHSTA-1-4]
MAEHSTIHVKFFDAQSGQLMGEAEMPASNLPQSFEASTTFQIEGRSYQVVSASPMTAREFRASGTLRIDMREVRIETANPRDILYSLPTLCEQLPSIEEGSTKLGRRVLELHEDDWRQVELVTLLHQGAIEEDLRAVERIHTEHRKGPGFDALHMRKAVVSPLEGTLLTLADLRSALGEAATWLDGIAFQGVAGLVEDGFAVKLPSGLALYGTQEAGRVAVLGLHGAGAGAAVEGDARLLAALATRHQLCLVDWCRVEQLPASAQRFQAWMSGG